jgi:multidrug efflux pump subunit AcrA (membrane-fusion protein)
MSVQRQIDLAGTLLSPDQARVSAEAAGVVRKVYVEIGREVGVGTPLVQIEPRELALARSGRRRPRGMMPRPPTNGPRR